MNGLSTYSGEKGSKTTLDSIYHFISPFSAVSF